jgi:hypothetical protein
MVLRRAAMKSALSFVLVLVFTTTTAFSQQAANDSLHFFQENLPRGQWVSDEQKEMIELVHQAVRDGWIVLERDSAETPNPKIVLTEKGIKRLGEMEQAEKKVSTTWFFVSGYVLAIVSNVLLEGSKWRVPVLWSSFAFVGLGLILLLGSFAPNHDPTAAEIQGNPFLLLNVHPSTAERLLDNGDTREVVSEFLDRFEVALEETAE